MDNAASEWLCKDLKFLLKGSGCGEEGVYWKSYSCHGQRGNGMVWASKRVQTPAAKTDIMVESLKSEIRTPCGRNGVCSYTSLKMGEVSQKEPVSRL